MFCSGQLRKYRELYIWTLKTSLSSLLYSGHSFEYYISIYIAYTLLCINAACKPFKNSVGFYLFSVSLRFRAVLLLKQLDFHTEKCILICFLLLVFLSERPILFPFSLVFLLSSEIQFLEFKGKNRHQLSILKPGQVSLLSFWEKCLKNCTFKIIISIINLLT